MVNIEPIGFFQAIEDEKYAVSRQSGVIKNAGKIILNPHCNYEAALEDLDGFDRIFVIYHFDRNNSWKPKVLPPRGDKKRGVFATRSPHRPNFLGLSCLELTKVDGLTLSVINHDLLDGTPIFDIKPYLVYADSFPNAKQGWLDTLKQEETFTIEWIETATKKLEFLENQWNVAIASNIYPRLSVHPFPKKQNRIKDLQNGLYEIAFKTWRISYKIKLNQILISDIYSGYDAATLTGDKISPYDDLECHLQFIKFFGNI